jgi:hypothetical protein
MPLSKGQNMQLNGKNRRKCLWLLCAAAAFAGCAQQIDLQAVQKYAQATADAGTSFSVVASGYYASCLRRHELNLPPSQWAKVLINLPPTASPQPQPSITPPSGPQNDPSCEQAHRVSIAWDSGNNILLGYVQALGNVAGVDVQPTFAPLISALVSANALPAGAQTPIQSLASDLSNIIISGDLRQDIATTVSAANPSMKAATDGLKLVSTDYATYLQSEHDDTNTYYRGVIWRECQAALPSSPKKPQVSYNSAITISSCADVRLLSPSLRDTIFLQRQRWNQALTAVNQALQANTQYADAIDTIETTHQHLYDATQKKLDVQDYINILQKDVMPLYQDAENLRKATQ